MGLELQPITFLEACEFINQHHRHHLPPQGWKYGIAVNNGSKIIGIITIGRPVSRVLDNGYTAEVTRCCTDGTPHAASKLYAAAWGAARAMGYKRMVTYTLIGEKGTSIKAAGWKELYITSGGSWNCKTRPRIDKAPTGKKRLFEIVS